MSSMYLYHMPTQHYSCSPRPSISSPRSRITALLNSSVYGLSSCPRWSDYGALVIHFPDCFLGYRGPRHRQRYKQYPKLPSLPEHDMRPVGLNAQEMMGHIDLSIYAIWSYTHTHHAASAYSALHSSSHPSSSQSSPAQPEH